MNTEGAKDPLVEALTTFEKEMKKHLEDSIVRNKMKELEQDVRSIVKRELESFIICYVGKERNEMSFNETLNVQIKYSDGETYRKDGV